MRRNFLRSRGVFEFGNGLQFNGVDTIVDGINYPVNFINYSVSFWVKYNGGSSYVYAGTGANDNNNSLAILSSTFMRIWDFLGNVSNFNPNLIIGQKTHFLISVGNGYANVYKDGGLIANIPSFLGGVNIGKLGSRGGAGFLNGVLDEISICIGYEATAQDAIDLYNAGLGDFATSVLSNVVGYYRCNQVDGDTLLIDSRNNQDGVLNNFVAPYFVPF